MRSGPACPATGVDRDLTKRTHGDVAAGDGGHRPRQLRRLVVAPGRKAQRMQGDRDEDGIVPAADRSHPPVPSTAPRRARSRPGRRVLRAKHQLSTDIRVAHDARGPGLPTGAAMGGGIPRRSAARHRRSGTRQRHAAEIAGGAEDEGRGRPAGAAEREILIHPRPAIETFGRKDRMQHRLPFSCRAPKLTWGHRTGRANP